jgi:hypothetical protein
MTPHERLIEIVTHEVGVKESGGDNHGPRVEEYQKAVDNIAHGESWCMAFVQWAIKQVEAEFGIKSVLFKSEHCLTVWNKTPASARLATPIPGAVIIWRHGDTTNGHTGIVTSVTANNVGTVEGNTSDGKGVNRNGDGVYARIRSRVGSGAMQVVGWINPFPTV